MKNPRLIINVDNFLSVLPKQKWFWFTIMAVVAFLGYYGLTILIFGEEFWMESIGR